MYKEVKKMLFRDRSLSANRKRLYRERRMNNEAMVATSYAIHCGNRDEKVMKTMAGTKVCLSKRPLMVRIKFKNIASAMVSSISASCGKKADHFWRAIFWYKNLPAKELPGTSTITGWYRKKPLSKKAYSTR